LVLYQKIFIREVIPTLRHPTLIFLSIILSFSLASSEKALPKDNNNTQNESFLSLAEYGKMLYKSPRGISCAKCHGATGKGGKKIAKYYDKHQNIKLLKSIDITNYSLSDLNASLHNNYRENNRRKRHKIMPMYYLTAEEILAIFTYLEKGKKK